MEQCLPLLCSPFARNPKIVLQIIPSGCKSRLQCTMKEWRVCERRVCNPQMPNRSPADCQDPKQWRHWCGGGTHTSPLNTVRPYKSRWPVQHPPPPWHLQTIFYNYSLTHCVQVCSNIAEIVATRCQEFKTEVHQVRFRTPRLELTPRPRPPSWIWGVLL